MARLLAIEPIIGLKDGVGDIELMQRIVNNVRGSDHQKADTFLFFDGLPTAEVTIGAYRAIGVRSYSSAVHHSSQRWHMLSSLRSKPLMRRAVRLLNDFFIPFAALRDQVPGYAVSLVKEGASIRGVEMGLARPPLPVPTPAHKRDLALLLEAGLMALQGSPTETANSTRRRADASSTRDPSGV